MSAMSAMSNSDSISNADLVAKLKGINLQGIGLQDTSPQDTSPQAMTSDSRKVCAGGLFAAFSDGKLDGRDFIPDALARGAKVVLVAKGSAKPASLPADTIWLESSEPRRQFAELASLYHAQKPQQIVAVTGTNGKTSSVIFLQQLWFASGIPCASIGTLGLGKNGGAAMTLESLGNLTTPEPIALHSELAQLASEGITHCSLEASSHGLAQHRLDGLRCSAAILTNISQDHLDYHKTWDNYRAAKKRLFSELLQENAWVVLPCDEPFAQEVIKEFHKKACKKACKEALAKRAVRLLTTRLSEEEFTDLESASLSAFDLRIDEERGVTNFSLRFALKDFCKLEEGSDAELGYILLENMQVPFVERFQLKNLLGAIAVFVALQGNKNDNMVGNKNGVAEHPLSKDELEVLLKNPLAKLKSVRGRMQPFKHRARARARIFVDFAHTPQALEFVLCEGRRLLGASSGGGRLLCLFGCGGERESEKRPLMGEIAARLADRIYITDDNPRREKPEDIRKEILKPLLKLAQENQTPAKQTQAKQAKQAKPVPFFCELDDRKLAIEKAIGDMLDGDILIVAGKGHERGQIVGELVRPFDDAKVVQKILDKEILDKETLAQETVAKETVGKEKVVSPDAV